MTGKLPIRGLHSIGGWTLLVAAVVARLTPLLNPSISPSIQLFLEMLGLILWWIGAVIVCFGVARFRSLLFPLCFLLLLVPVPTNVLDWVAEWLQQESAIATTVLFKAAGVPITRDDVMLSIPGLDIEVARECSSIRSSTMLIVATLVLVHLFLQTWWRRSLLILFAIPLSVAKNAVRIFTIAELGTRVDPGFLTGKLHHDGGIVFLMIALGVDIGVLWMLRLGEDHLKTKNPLTFASGRDRGSVD